MNKVVVLFVIVLFFNPNAHCSEPLDLSDHGLAFEWHNKNVSAKAGASLDVGYRLYNERERSDSTFNIFRSRLRLTGLYCQKFRFGLEYDFKSTADHMTDAYVAWQFYPLFCLKAGKFKTPFSFEWQSADNTIFFAQRSMGNALTPKRDIGMMLAAYYPYPFIHSTMGIFNGTSGKQPTQGRQRDEPEFVSRLTLSPFKKLGFEWIESLQIGWSTSYCRINLSQIDIEIKTTGMTDSNRNLYVLNPNTKFGVLYDVNKRTRSGLEAFWSIGPMAFQYEYIRMKLSELKPATGDAMNAEFSSGYVSLLVSLTGEKLSATPEGLCSVKPVTPMNEKSGFGAFLFSARGEYFHGDENWIKKELAVSVQRANAKSFALIWLPNDFNRIIMDYTQTRFSDPLRIRINTDGTIVYNERETVFNIRWCIDF